MQPPAPDQEWPVRHVERVPRPPAAVIPLDRGERRDTMDYVGAWLRQLTARNYSPETVRVYAGPIYRFLGWASLAGHKHCLDLTEDDVVDFYSGIGDNGPAKMSYMQALRSFYGYLHRRGHVQLDPTEYLMPRIPPPPPPRAFTVEEITRLLVAAAWHDERRAWAILLCYSLGTRRSELAGIRESDISAGYVDVTGKGRKARRIPLNSMAVAAIEGLRATSPRKEAGRDRGTLLGWIPQTFTMYVGHAARDAELPWDRRRAHMLRSSFATHLHERGATAAVIRDLLGHENIRTTNRYLVSQEKARRDAVELLG